MPGPDNLFLLASALPPPSGGLWAYVGLGPGEEFIPYFFALLSFVGAALVALLQWPLGVLHRCLTRTRGGPGGGQSDPCVAAQPRPELAADGSPERP